MNSQRARDALRALSARDENYEADIARSSSQPALDSDNDGDAECPFFESFYAEGGNQSIKTMCNLTAPEFRLLYNKMHDEIVENWNTGRGRRSPFKAMDVFFMLLTTMKHGGSWDVLGKMFNIKTSTFERTVVKFLSMISPHMYETFVKGVPTKYTLRKLHSDGTMFKTFNFAIDAVDVTFQQANRPTGNHSESKVYYSGKHHLYGYKLEVCVRPNGLASDVSRHYPGSVADISIMSDRVSIHRARLQKTGSDTTIEDEADQSDVYPNEWAVLADKGYQGSHEMIRSITPYKNPRRGSLSAEEETYNKELAIDRIIVENFFGRMHSLWKIMARKYVWGEKLYDGIANLCVALTNFHIENLPLRTMDGSWYNRYVNRLISMGEDGLRSRAVKQQEYRARRRRRLAIGFREIITNTEQETQEPEY